MSTALRHGILAALVLVAWHAPAASAQETETEVAREALAICRRADRLPPAEGRALLDRGLALAERAIADRPDDPVAHFAAFCNRGKRIEAAGLSFRILGEVRRVRHHIERALELAPDWSEALAGKGALLLALPGPLGGDRTEGERLLRRALALDPSNLEARERLGEVLRVGAASASDTGPCEG